MPNTAGTGCRHYIVAYHSMHLYFQFSIESLKLDVRCVCGVGETEMEHAKEKVKIVCNRRIFGASKQVLR